jgi:saccharopine dehydrogenase-like NADP-dependent oxidoreductase
LHNVLIAGAGKIGSLIACLLAESGDYQVYLVDKHFTGDDVSRLRARFSTLKAIETDVQDQQALMKVVRDHAIGTIISSLPYYCNVAVAKVCRELNVNYFDLTEDVSVTNAVTQLAQGAISAFVPQCGLAPGFINIVAHTLMQNFDELDSVKLRVGALPQQSSNALNYALTWSTDGVINEYGNPCHAIENGKEVMVAALSGLEFATLDGLDYEAFNTSGGLGSLAKTYLGKVRNLSYKTLRYPGHCEKMRLLMNDLRLNEDRETLKRILERAIPKTYQDLVLIYVSVIGKQKGQLMEESYVKKVYPQEIAGLKWSAIQVTTASGITSVVDAVLKTPERYRGLVLQEQFVLKDVTDSRFGKCYL